MGACYDHAAIDMDTVSLNNEGPDSIADPVRRKVAGHEAGHALGLFHPPNGVTSMMNQGYPSASTPMSASAYDEANVRMIYPNALEDTP